jgi:hypothetical protein
MWVYTKDYVVYDADDSNFPKEYMSKPIGEIFKDRESVGAANYEKLVEDINKSRDGKGWFQWSSAKGKEYGAWASIKVNNNSWTIGLSTVEDEIYELSGVNAEFKNILFICFYISYNFYIDVFFI